MDHLVEKIEHNAHNAPKTNATTETTIHYAAETADLLLQLAREVHELKRELEGAKARVVYLEGRMLEGSMNTQEG